MKEHAAPGAGLPAGLLLAGATRRAGELEAALTEARARAGAQFSAAAVEALEKLAARGDLMPVAARLHQPTA